MVEIGFMKTGIKQRRIQVNKRLRKISVDRESIFNKLMNTQALISQGKDKEIKEDDKEYDESSKIISLAGDPLNQTNEAYKSRLHMESQYRLDKFLLESGTDSSMSPDIVSVNPLKDDEFKHLAHESPLYRRKQSLKDRKRNSKSVFNNNKFTMAVKIDNEK